MSTELGERLTQIIEQTDAASQWSVAVLDPNGALVYGHQPRIEHRAASHGKLVVGLAAQYSGVSREQTVAITKADRRSGNGSLDCLPDNYLMPFGTAVRKMLSGDNTATVAVARTIRERYAVDDTAQCLNALVHGKLELSSSTGLKAHPVDKRRFTYGSTTALDSATLMQASIEFPWLKAGLSRGNMWFGMRQLIDTHIRGTPPEVLRGERIAKAGIFVGRILPRRFYDNLVATEWPATDYPNKEASDNDRDGHIRGDVMATPERFVVAALHSTPWLEGRQNLPPFGPTHLANDTFAEIGFAVAEHAKEAA